MTSSKDKGKRDIAIQQINKRFTAVKNIKVGYPKGSEHPGVVAAKVVDFLPFH
jgi:hypothetical protein